jgi:hypothetical protein
MTHKKENTLRRVERGAREGAGFAGGQPIKRRQKKLSAQFVVGPALLLGDGAQMDGATPPGQQRNGNTAARRRSPLRRQISSNTATARTPGAAASIGTISLCHTGGRSGSRGRRPRGCFLRDVSRGSASIR